MELRLCGCSHYMHTRGGRHEHVTPHGTRRELGVYQGVCPYCWHICCTPCSDGSQTHQHWWIVGFHYYREELHVHSNTWYIQYTWSKQLSGSTFRPCLHRVWHKLCGKRGNKIQYNSTLLSRKQEMCDGVTATLCALSANPKHNVRTWMYWSLRGCCTSVWSHQQPGSCELFPQTVVHPEP